MSLSAEKSFRMKMRDVETAFKYRRFPYPKRSVELIALLAISCTFFLFMHTNKLNSRLKEMEMKLQPSEFSALGLTGGNHLDSPKREDINSLHGTYQYLKSTGQHHSKNKRDHDRSRKYEEERIEHIAKHHPLDKEKHQDKFTHYSEDDHDVEEEYDDEDEYYDYLNAAADALNNTKKADVEVVIFNRVPKVGSQSLMQLMIQLGKINNFIHSRDAGKSHETILLNATGQKALIEEIYRKPKPHIYSQHLAYVNFTRFKMPKPIYINLVRDPVERIISWHYYVRAEWYYEDMALKLGDKAPKRPSDEFMNMDLDTCVQKKDKYCTFNQMEIKNPVGDHRRQTLFFCGQNRKLCMPFNSKAAMQKAKRTVEEEYAVVGTWEDTNITLSVLEHYIPRFFKHAKAAFHLSRDHLSRVNKNKDKRPVSDLTKELLRKNLTHEIEFYEFCKQRLYLQYAAINDGEMIDNDDYVLIPDHEEETDDEKKKNIDTLNPKLLNNTQFATFDFLIFNRVPKVGSEQLIELIRRLSEKNKFGFSRAPFSEPISYVLDEDDQAELTETIHNMGTPYAYSKHFNYINFRKYNLPQPIYINMVRDPVERVISWFYYRRAPWTAVQTYKVTHKFRTMNFYKKTYEQCVRQKDPECVYMEGANFEQTLANHIRQSLYFCGHDPVCEPFNSYGALQKAKENVEHDFAVVGSWEDVNVTLRVLEHYVPKYFKGVTKLYYADDNGLFREKHNSNPWKPPVNEEIKNMLFSLSSYHLNNTMKSEVDLLFFNRVPKTGSMQLISLLKQLGKLHDYDVEVDPNNGGIRASMTKREQETMIENISNLDEGFAFVSHMNYLNFTQYGHARPIYINMVRDPVERVISWYYYLRSPWIFVPGRRRHNRTMPNPHWVNTEFDQCVLSKENACTYIEGSGLERPIDHRRQTLFFCGHNASKCLPFNTRIPLEIAKRTVEKEYAVVGTWEDTNITLSVLENYVPRYFRGATKMYYGGLNANIQNSNPFKPHISEEIKQMVRKNFTREIEFYQFCRQRLHKQYLALKQTELRELAIKEEEKKLSFLKKALLKLN
ncbi:heparan sulfate 2-O-sulfotransferase pipe [Cochliomyia hominivorax]